MSLSYKTSGLYRGVSTQKQVLSQLDSIQHLTVTVYKKLIASLQIKSDVVLYLNPNSFYGILYIFNSFIVICFLYYFISLFNYSLPR